MFKLWSLMMLFLFDFPIYSWKLMIHFLIYKSLRYSILTHTILPTNYKPEKNCIYNGVRSVNKICKSSISLYDYGTVPFLRLRRGRTSVFLLGSRRSTNKKKEENDIKTKDTSNL